MASDYPRTYPEWRRCITVDCGIELTARYVEGRIAALGNPADRHTAQFAELYGTEYLEQVIRWFQMAAAELEAGTGAASDSPT